MAAEVARATAMKQMIKIGNNKKNWKRLKEC